MGLDWEMNRLTCQRDGIVVEPIVEWKRWYTCRIPDSLVCYAFRATHMSFATALVHRIIDFYLNSPDFNGIRANVILGDSGPDAPKTLKKLVERGLVEVYSSEYDNPHIKRLPALSIPEQLRFLEQQTAKSTSVFFHL